MTLPAQRADRASPCNTATRVNPAQLAAPGNKGKRGGKRQGHKERVDKRMDVGRAGRAISESGQETESGVVERGHSTTVTVEGSLDWENLTQRNKGFVVMSSV